MPRFHCHIAVTDELWETCDPMITVSVWAHDDQMAQLNAVALMRQDLDFEIVEVDLADPDPTEAEIVDLMAWAKSLKGPA